MKLYRRMLLLAMIAATAFSLNVMSVHASDDEYRVVKGIDLEGQSLEGMSKEEVIGYIDSYVNNARSKKVDLIVKEDAVIETSPDALGMEWINSDIIDQIMIYGQIGNPVHRYKQIKDLLSGRVLFELELDYDRLKIEEEVSKAKVYDIPAIDCTLKRMDGAFVISGCQTGMELNLKESVDKVYYYLKNDWNVDDGDVQLVVSETIPRGSVEELTLVQDLLGTYTTSYTTSGSSRVANIRNGCSLVNETTLYPGDTMSVLENLTPFTTGNGYELAGSYLNGRVVDSLGGGICQVSTTLYNAVLNSDLEVAERHNHSMTISYVELSRDAAIAESSGKDLKFTNNTEYPIYVEGITTPDKKITFNIYGVDKRGDDRNVRYESEILETIPAGAERVIADGGQPIGVVSVQSAHTGYKARLWKIITENGVEVSRDIVNISNYNMVPRTATVGTATADPNVATVMAEAIATGNIDHVRATVAGLTQPPPEATVAVDAQP